MIININASVYLLGIDNLKSVFQQIDYTMGFQTVENAFDKLTDIMFEMGLQQPVLNNSEELNILVKSVNITRLQNNPVRFSEEDIYKLYTDIINSKVVEG